MPIIVPGMHGSNKSRSAKLTRMVNKTAASRDIGPMPDVLSDVSRKLRHRGQGQSGRLCSCASSDRWVPDLNGPTLGGAHQTGKGEGSVDLKEVVQVEGHDRQPVRNGRGGNHEILARPQSVRFRVGDMEVVNRTEFSGGHFA